MVSPVVMYGCESGNIKKAGCQRIVFELWIWRRLLRVTWTIRSNQSIPKEINPEYPLEGLMLKLKHNTLATWWKNWLIGKDTNAGKDWKQEKGTTEDEMVGWHHWLDAHEFEQAPEVDDGQGSLVSCSPWGCQESDSTKQLNWSSHDELSHWLSMSYQAGFPGGSDGKRMCPQRGRPGFNPWVGKIPWRR